MCCVQTFSWHLRWLIVLYRFPAVNLTPLYAIIGLLPIFDVVCYINSRFTYLLTYLFTYSTHIRLCKMFQVEVMLCARSSVSANWLVISRIITTCVAFNVCGRHCTACQSCSQRTCPTANQSAHKQLRYRPTSNESTVQKRFSALTVRLPLSPPYNNLVNIRPLTLHL